MNSDRFDGKNNAEIVYFYVDNHAKLPSISDLKERITRQLKWNKESKDFRVEDFTAINIRNYVLKEIVCFDTYPNGDGGYKVHIYYTHNKTIYTRILLVTSIVLAFFTWGISLLLFIVPLLHATIKSVRTLPGICESLVSVIKDYNDEINNCSLKSDQNEEKVKEIKDKIMGATMNSSKGEDYIIAEDGTIIRD